jgi:hypothetical protein
MEIGPRLRTPDEGLGMLARNRTGQAVAVRANSTALEKMSSLS